MKRLLLVALAVLLVCLAVPVVDAARTDLQSYSLLPFNQSPAFNPFTTNDTVGGVRVYFWGFGRKITTISPRTFDYLAFDLYQTAVPGLEFYADDGVTRLHTFNGVTNFSGNSIVPTRAEFIIVSGIPYVYSDGACIYTGTYKSSNPAYIRIQPGNFAAYVSNFVYGDTDHHTISTFPYNWSIINDIVYSGSTGVYAVKPSGSTDLKNSNYFIIDADTDVHDTVLTETLVIMSPSGRTVNSTPIDSTVGHHEIVYQIPAFLAEADGEYGRFSAHMTGSEVYTYFNVIASGASVSFDSDEYTELDEAVLTYVISANYWDTSAYDYSMEIISGTTGATLQTSQISSSTGTSTYVFKDTDPTGAVYAAVVATPKLPAGSKGVWLNFDYAEYYKYSTFDGYVNDAETGLPITGANVTITQNDVFYSLDATDATGFYDSSGTNFVSGTQLTFNVTAALHEQYYANIIPASETSIRTNFTLNSATPAVTGLGIGGVARDGIFDDVTRAITQGYGRPLSDATVYLWNFSNSQGYTKQTNIAGWYLCDDGSSCSLVPGRIYDVQGRKGGYANSTNYTVVTS